MEDKIRIIGSLNGKKKEIASSFIELFCEKYKDIDTEIYLGYPIYINEVLNTTTNVDIAIVSKIGVFIINILENNVFNYGELQDEIYSKVESKFKKQPHLFKQRKLIFDFYAITYCENQSEEEGYPLAYNVNDLMNFVNSNSNIEMYFNDDTYRNIISALQEANGINDRRLIEDVKEGTKASYINKMNNIVEKYGASQMEAILSDVDGIQRIRGMAGSGKTVVLARKAVELHTAHPDWDIVVTYSTRSLKKQFEKLIGRFYASKNDGAKYNEKKLKIMHSWGSLQAKGVYYEICTRHEIDPKTYGSAKQNYGNDKNVFSKICKEVLREVKDFKKMYDCILIDEAQDFDNNFLKLCLKVLDRHQRLVYAYDELQSLSEESMPSPENIFEKPIDHDTPLTVCYRNQGPVIVTAHAIGMGLYRKEGLVQLPSSSDVWEAIGYVSDSPIVEGKEVTLYRTKETSPDFLGIDKDEVIKFYSTKDENEMYSSVIEMIKKDIYDEKLSPGEIMIIDLDSFHYSNNYYKMHSFLRLYEEEEWLANDDNTISIHLAGSSTPEDYFRPDSVVYSGIRRAKGNECYMVYIVNAQSCVNTLRNRSDRNALFTALTRSKGWVNVFGYGDNMQYLIDEFDIIKNHDFKLYFNKYPTEEEKKTIYLNNKDIEKNDARTIDQTRKLIDKLSKQNISKTDLMTQLFNVSKEELLRIINSENEEK